MDPMPGHLSPPQPGGGIMQEETDTKDEETNRHIDAIFDEKAEGILDKERLLTQQEQ